MASPAVEPLHQARNTGTLSDRTNTSREPSKLSDRLISRANTFLRTATLSARHRKPATANAKSTKATENVSSIPTAIDALERERTRLETTVEEEEEDEEMKMLLMDLKKYKLAHVKEHTDSDFDTDLEEDFVPTSTPSTWKDSKLYLKTCNKLGLRPVPFIEHQLNSGKEILVRNRCMNALDVLALTNCLLSNQKITRLVLDGNAIGDDGAMCIAWLMSGQESFLEHVSLTENDIGDEGFRAIGEMLQKNKVCSTLNLSGNRGQDDNLLELTRALMERRTLTNLNLSHNYIGDFGANILATALASNDGLVYLDLSWNKIQPDGCIAIVTALRENITLKSMNMAMNGLTTQGTKVLSEVLQGNERLTYLNISYNRVFDSGCAYLAKALEKNETLHHLILHNNPITATGALSLLSGIRSNKNTGLWKIDIHTIQILRQCEQIAEEISYHNGGDFELRHAGVVDSEVNMVSTDNKLDYRNPMAVVKNYVEEEGLRMIDFFKQMDKDHGGSISRDEFIEGLAQAGVPMSNGAIDHLIEMLDKDGDGEIDYGELIEGHRQYKRLMLKKKMKEMEIIRDTLRKNKELQDKLKGSLPSKN